MSEWLHDDSDTKSALLDSGSSSSKLIHKLRLSLIECFTIRRKKRSSYRFSVFVSLLLSFVIFVQGLSLVYREQDSIAGYSDQRNFFAIINFFRVETILYKLNWSTAAFVVMMVAIYTPVLILTGNVLGSVLFKRAPMLITVEIMLLGLDLLEGILFFPALVMLESYIKYTVFMSTAGTAREYYIDASVFRSVPCAVISILTLPILVASVYLYSYFFYENVFSKRFLYIHAMSNSEVHRLHILGRVGMVSCYVALSEVGDLWAHLCIAGICLVFCVLSLQWGVFYNTVINVENASRKALISWGVGVYYIAWWANSASVILLLLLLVSPVIVGLIYIYVGEQKNRWRKMHVSDVAWPYQVGLKLNCLLDEYEQADKSEKERIHSVTENLFKLATIRFWKSPLIWIWEANYYFYYRRDPFLACIKLSKLQLAEETLESSFFVSRNMRKFTKKEGSAARQYLIYLKLLESAKRTDEICCLQLLNFCSELLSHRSNPSKCEKMILQLSSSMRKTVRKYFKILELYNENQIVLHLLGTFLCEIMREEDGRGLIMRGQLRRNSELRRVSSAGNLFDDENGLLILHCGIETLGSISLTNIQTCRLLKCGFSDLMRKNVGLFLPQPLAKVHSKLLTRLVTLSSDIKEAEALFQVLVDNEGLISPVSVSVKLTTWENSPYLILTLTQWSRTEYLMIVDKSWEIIDNSNFSGLPGATAGMSYRYSHIHSMFPHFLDLYSPDQSSYKYVGQEGSELIITLQPIAIPDTNLTLISIEKVEEDLGLRLSLRIVSPTPAIPESDKKGVRFGTSDSTKKAPEQHTTVLATHSDQHESAMVSDTEARIKKKLTISTSIQSSLFGAKALDMRNVVQINKYAKRMKLLLLLAFVILIAGLIGSVVFISNLLASLTSIDLIKEYCIRNQLIVDLAYDARSMMLSDDVLYPYASANVSASILQKVANLSSILGDVEGRVSSDTQTIQKISLTPSVPVWTFSGMTYETENLPLIEALLRVTMAGNRLANAPPPYNKSTDAFFLYRNAVGEILEMVNTTLSLYVKSDQVARLNDLSIINVLVIVDSILMLVPVFLLVGPLLYLLELEQRKVWKLIYTIPRETVLDVRTVAQDRLQSYFDNEVVIEGGKSKDKNHEPKPTPFWLTFLLKMCVYWVVTTVLFLTVEYAYVSPLQDLAITIPNYTEWAGMRPVLLAQGMFWSREVSLLQDSSYDYFRQIPYGGLWADPRERVKNATTSIEFISKVLNFGFEKLGVLSVKKSNSYLDFVYTSVCADVYQPDCQDVGAGYGMAYQLLDWKATLLDITHTPSPPQTRFSMLTTIEGISTEATNSLLFTLDFIQADNIQQINSLRNQIIALNVGFIILILLLYVFLYIPAVNSMREQSTVAQHIYRAMVSRDK